MHVYIINGPNLNLLGTREVAIYGHCSFDDFLPTLQVRFPEVEFSFFQSNVEGELINALHEAAGIADAVILNGAAYTHTSIALGDAVAAISIPVVEVHISNIYSRETFRKNSFTAAHCAGVITGFGMEGYALAVQYLTQKKSSGRGAG